jgi:hypothetical protein
VGVEQAAGGLARAGAELEDRAGGDPPRRIDQRRLQALVGRDLLVHQLEVALWLETGFVHSGEYRAGSAQRAPVGPRIASSRVAAPVRPS